MTLLLLLKEKLGKIFQAKTKVKRSAKHATDVAAGNTNPQHAHTRNIIVLSAAKKGT